MSFGSSHAALPANTPYTHASSAPPTHLHDLPRSFATYPVIREEGKHKPSAFGTWGSCLQFTGWQAAFPGISGFSVASDCWGGGLLVGRGGLP